MGQRKSRHINKQLMTTDSYNEERQIETAENSEERTLTSDRSLTYEDTSSSTICSANTSFGLISLPAEHEVGDWPLQPIDHREIHYLDGVKKYITREPVYRRRRKHAKVVRRLQAVRHSKVGYTQLFRELRRRRGQKIVELPPLTKLFEQLSLRPERSFQRGSTDV